MRGVSFGLALVLACGCAVWMPPLVAGLKPEDMAKQETWILVLTCRSREHATRPVITELVRRQDVRPEDAQGCPELVDEFVRRGVFRKGHAARIKAGKVVTGMNANELRGAWGAPSDANRTVSRWGTRTQHVYGDFGPYVYTRDGIVTSWQD